MARIRAGGSTALILILSALGRAANRVEGLEKGADDYLPKPFEPEELRARVAREVPIWREVIRVSKISVQ